MDYCSDRVCTPADQFNFRRNYSRSDFDHTQVYVQSFLYELPFGRAKKWLNPGFASHLLGDWQINAVFTAQTGRPSILLTATPV